MYDFYIVENIFSNFKFFKLIYFLMHFTKSIFNIIY